MYFCCIVYTTNIKLLKSNGILCYILVSKSSVSDRSKPQAGESSTHILFMFIQ